MYIFSQNLNLRCELTQSSQRRRYNLLPNIRFKFSPIIFLTSTLISLCRSSFMSEKMETKEAEKFHLLSVSLQGQFVSKNLLICLLLSSTHKVWKVSLNLLKPQPIILPGLCPPFVLHIYVTWYINVMYRHTYICFTSFFPSSACYLKVWAHVATLPLPFRHILFPVVQ